MEHTKTYTSFVVLTIMVFILFIASGCTITNNIANTKMIINKDGSGKRIVTCPVSKFENKINGGELALDNFITEKLPKQFTFDKQQTAFGVNYIFTLEFDSNDDYIQKVNGIINKNPDILFSTPSNIFTYGFILNENFTSEDLMAWINNGLIEEGIIKSGSHIWKYDKTEVCYDNTVYDTSNNIDCLALSFLPINKIGIDTTLNSNGSIDRSVKFYIPYSTCEATNNNLYNYMQTLVPSGASSVWNETMTNKVFTITFTSPDTNSLNNNMNIILDNNKNKSSILTQDINVFNTANVFNEKLDFTSFISYSNGKTLVDYNVKSDLENNINDAKILQNYNWVGLNDSLNLNQFKLNKDTDVLEISLIGEDKYPVSSVDIETYIDDYDKFRRDIILKFGTSTNIIGAQKAKEYFDKLKIEYTTVDNIDDLCIISIKGNSKEITFAQNKLLDNQNTLSVQKQTGFDLYNSNNYTDILNINSFLQKIGYLNQVNYKLNSYQDIENYSLTNNGNTQIDNLNKNIKNFNNVLPNSGVYELSITTSSLNSTFLFVILIISFITVISFIAIIYLIINKFNVKHKVLFHSLTSDNQFNITNYICSNCYTPIVENMNYCIHCGSLIVGMPKNLE